MTARLTKNAVFVKKSQEKLQGKSRNASSLEKAQLDKEYRTGSKRDKSM